MKHASYVVFSPAVQDRFWSRLGTQDGRLVSGMKTNAQTMAYPMCEQTTSARKKVPFDALVDYCITYSVPWHIMELGMEGALVHMDTMGLQVGASTEFVLRFKYNRQPVEHRIPAIVERINARGVALRFSQYDEETRNDLARLLYAL